MRLIGLFLTGLLLILLWSGPVSNKPLPRPAEPILPFDDLADRYRDFSYYQAAAYRNADPDRPMVALTFDDGPDPAYTAPILEILHHYNVPATFFLVGENVEKYPYLAREEAATEEVGSHTYSHPNLLTLSPAEMRWQLAENARVIHRVTGVWPRFFRAPYGLFSRGVFDEAERLGERVTMWTICLEHHGVNTPAAMAERVIRKTKPGYIILMHDARLNRDNTVRALPLVISGLEARGFRFVTLSELLRESRPPTERVEAGHASL